MSVFEALMIACFGLGWPLSIFKALKTRVVAGKSQLFMVVIWLGYLCGIIHKLFFAMDWVIALYILNFLMVGLDLFLYFLYRQPRSPTEGTPLSEA